MIIFKTVNQQYGQKIIKIDLYLTIYIFIWVILIGVTRMTTGKNIGRSLKKTVHRIPVLGTFDVHVICVYVCACVYIRNKYIIYIWAGSILS